MSDYLEATLKNPRWWVTLPFSLFVILPLMILQIAMRAIAFMARSVAEGIEELGNAINKPVHAWWKEDAQRRQAAARSQEDF